MPHRQGSGHEARHVCVRSSNSEDKLEEKGAIEATEPHFLTHNVLTTDLEHWAASNRVPVVNVQRLLDQDRDVLMSWVHLSPRGNRMIAEALAEKIEQLVGHCTVRQPKSRTELVGSFGS